MDNIFSIDVSSEPSEVHAMFRSIEKTLDEKFIQSFDSEFALEDRLQWSKGDRTNMIWASVQAKKLRNKQGRPYTFLDICYFVSIRFLRGTRSFNTVKSWALVARRYSPAVRQLYHYDEVEFAHFAYAAQRKFDIDSDTGQKMWQDVLEYSHTLSQIQGRPASQKQLEARFEGKRITKSQFNPTANEYHVNELDVSGIEASQLVDIPASSDTLEAEFSETLHRLSGLVSRISAKYPIFSGSVNNAYAVLSNTLLAMVGRNSNN